MRKQVRRRHEAHVRALSVCTEHSAFFDATAGGQKARATFGSHVAEIDRLFAVQERSIEDRRAATEQGRRSRRALRDAAKAVVSVGKVVDLGSPVVAALRLPGATSDDGLLAYSRALLERALERADALVAEGLPPDLPKHLGEAIEAFAGAREAQAASRQRFTAATESILETLDSAAKTLAVLEAIALNNADAPPELLTRLRIARRVGPRVSAPPAKPADPSPTSDGKAA